jgi:capsular exopolysaccharide synthesis family protein
MTHDEHLAPRAGRDLDSTLAELTQGKPYSKYDAPATEVNFRDYLFIILKRKWLIMSLVMVITSLATIQAYRDPSVYEANTTLRIEPRSQSILSTSQVVINAQVDQNFWGTQLRLLQNPGLARQVALTLNLQTDPKFMGGQAQSGVFASLKRIFSREKPVTTTPKASSGVELVGEERLRARNFTPEELAALEPYEDAIAAGETIEWIDKTNLVTIHYQHTDPELAQKIANTLADIFIANNQEAATSGTSQAEITLGNQIAKTQEKIKQKSEERFDFARKHNLPIDNTPGSNLEAMRLATYSGQLLAAENERRNQQSIYDAAKNSPDPLTAPEVQSDQRIGRMREKLAELKDKRASLLELYTPEWPAIKQLDAQIEPLEKQLEIAPKEVFAGLKARKDAAAAHEKSLMGAYAKEHGITTQQTKDGIDMAVLTQDLETEKQYLNTLMQKLRELTITTSGGTPSEVSLSSYGRLPREPIGPARMRTIVLAFVLSLVAGIGLAFLLDFLDDTVKSVDDVDRYIHLPTLALIPAVRSEKPRLRGGEAAEAAANDTTALAMVSDVRSPIAESYRHLRTSLLLSSAGTQPRTILVTSSQPSEGKTTTAINTAFMLAQTGVPVLIIDCDLRRPRLHAHFNLPNARGLSNILSGDGNDLEGMIHTYEKQPNLKLLPSGPIPPNPAELLGSEEMRRLLTSLSEKFTHIIVDSPPAISFTDASILSTFVDGVILVIHGGRSSRAVVRRAKQKLLDVGAHIFGVVLNNVKVEGTHDYYYDGYYSGHYKSDYYGDDEEAPPTDDARAASS